MPNVSPRYCTPACARAHWPAHRDECSRAAERALSRSIYATASPFAPFGSSLGGSPLIPLCGIWAWRLFVWRLWLYARLLRTMAAVAMVVKGLCLLLCALLGIGEGDHY